MRPTQRFGAIAVVLAAQLWAFPAQKPSAPGQECDAPSYFGICDPYVPGTIIGATTDMKAIIVLGTWHDGPAEKAGVCPGDQIVAVNGIPVPGHTFLQMLKEFVSPSPSPITLKVKRGDQEMELNFQRVRESTLAQLSRQNFVRMRVPLDGIQVVPTPLDETREEVEELDRFYVRIDRRIGFKLVGNIEVPEGTPDEQVEKLNKVSFGGSESERFVGRTQLALGENSFSPGFEAVLLKDPPEVLVKQVFPTSPAHRAGLFPGDDLLEVNGRAVAGLSPKQVTEMLLKPDERREITLKIRRGQTALALKLETERAGQLLKSLPYLLVPAGGRGPVKAEDYVLGLDAVYAENPREAIVEHVDYPSPAFDAGLHSGDLILGVNGESIEQITRDRQSILLQPTAPSPMTLRVSRLGKQLEFRLTPVTYREAEAKIGRKITKNGPAPEHCPES